MNKGLTLFLDFESFFAPSEGYTLAKVAKFPQMSMIEYIRDSRFQAHGMGVAGIDGQPEWITRKSIPAYITAVAEQFGWPNITLVAHNTKFDASILHHVYECVPGQFICTKAMSKAVLGKTVKGHSLADLATHFGLESKGTMKTAGLRDLTSEQEKELAEYCLHDVWLCREIYKRLAKDFPQGEYAAMHRTIDMFVSPQLILNVPLLQETAKQEAARRVNIFKEIGIEKSIFASNKKFPQLLEERGFPVPFKPSPRKSDSEGRPIQIPALALGDPDFLEMLESENEELKTLCEARVAAKSTLLETRSTKLAAIGATGPWPFDVEYSGADQTHRLSGGNGAGGNPQNFGRCQDAEEHKRGHICRAELRRAVQAENGQEIVVGDSSNIELRIVAYLSKDPGLVQAIEQHVDIYCDFASVFYGRKITKANKAERHFGKTAILGLGYGMGADKFIKTVRVQTGQTITHEDSRKAIDLYRTRYNRVPALWEALDNVIPLIAQGCQTTVDVTRTWDLPGGISKDCYILPSNLPVRFPNLRQERGERGRVEWVYDVYVKRNLEKRKLYGGKLLENISQGLAGELCKSAMLHMGDAVTGLVHDEIHVVCKKGLGQVTAQKLKRVMSLSPSWLSQMQLDAEVGWGKTWGDCKH